jgi:hypothetical protein
MADFLRGALQAMLLITAFLLGWTLAVWTR